MSLNLAKELIQPPEPVKEDNSSLASSVRVGEVYVGLFRELPPLRPDMQVQEMDASVGRIA